MAIAGSVAWHRKYWGVIILNVVELFAGAGGLSLGLKKIGFNIVMANELEPIFSKTHSFNHIGTDLIVDDICKISFAEMISNRRLPHISLLSGGPPCQGFSTVGSKKYEDPRNQLFFQFLRAVKEISPDYVLFENVAGFMTLYSGEAFDLLVKNLNSLGYKTSSRMIDASDYGLPQIRKRTIVIGWKKNLNPVSVPSPTHHSENNIFGHPIKLSVMDAISDLPPLTANDEAMSYFSLPQNDYQKNMRDNDTILTEHNSSNYGEKMREILELIPEGGSVNDLPLHLRPKAFFNNTYARLKPNLPAPTITRNFGTPSSSRCIHPYQNRALSTREGARLQGFPDSYVFFGNKTQKNLQIGNAVPPIFGEIIGQAIMNSINHKKSVSF